MTSKGNTIVAGTFRESGRRYLVTLEYREEPAQLAEHGRTITHEAIPADAVEVAISGLTYYATEAGHKDRRYSDCVSAGQVVEELRKVPGNRAARIAALWERWHLNGMRGNCAHMPDQHYTPGLACPVAPYTSGSAWLFEPVPADVLAELRRLFGIEEHAAVPA